MKLAMRSLTLALAIHAGACIAPRAAVNTLEEGALAPLAAMRAEFFRNLTAHCGRTYSGRALHSATPDDPMLQAELRMHVASCSDTEIRVPFEVGEDRSRTWIITLRDGGLLLKHDHRHADGTPDEITNYGGWADASGHALLQRFPADDFTALLIPAAATNVWTLQIDTTRQVFVYDLQRHGQPRFRAEFNMAPADEARAPRDDPVALPPGTLLAQ